MKDTKRILIVEDEPKVAFFLQESLEAADPNYTVVSANCGEEALNQWSHAPFDLVVSDLRMPGINGLELLQRVREQSPTTPTILITAYGSDEVEAEARRLPACRYFTKPFQIQDLTSAVQAALDESALAETGKPALSGEQLERVTQRLSDLRYEVGAQCVLLSHENGQVLAQAGSPENLPVDQVVALVSRGLARASELAQLLREDRSFSLFYHEGARYDSYTAQAAKPFFITLIFDRRQGASRVGMVWLYTKRAIQDLGALACDDGPPVAGDLWPGV